jgi:serine/threonine-protein kinase
MGADGVHLERVRREARHLARLKHPGLPACHALFEDLQLGYLVVAMELVQGPTLAEAAPTLDEPQKIAVLRQIAATLAFLHESGVVHRDLKPENVILCHEFWGDPLRQGSVKLIDLGISVGSGNPTPLTVVGHVIGTPSFLAPEILDPHYFPALPGTPAVDVFAFGVLGWILLHGVHPTGLENGSSLTSYALAYRQADQSALWPPTSRSDRWVSLLRRCLAVRPRERLATGVDLLAFLTGGDAGLSPAPGATRLEPVADRASSLPATRLEPAPSFTPATAPAEPPRQPLPPPVPSASMPSPAPPPTPATVFAAPIPSSLAGRRPAVPGTSPSAPPVAPAVSRGAAPGAPRAPAPLAPSHPTELAKKTSIFRYILAAFLLLVGGGLAFFLTVILAILFALR